MFNQKSWRTFFLQANSKAKAQSFYCEKFISNIAQACSF